MKVIDVFNGDADGICSLVQLRLAYPVESKLVTGVKRDIALLGKVTANEGDEITVLDISMDKNSTALVSVLEAGAKVLYVDHHYAGDIPEHGNLNALINTSANTCTSLLMNKYLKRKYVKWAAVGAYGDNLNEVAEGLVASLHVNLNEKIHLKKLGQYINYNGYGATVEDLYFPPSLLFERLKNYSDPSIFIREDNEIFDTLEAGYQQDMALARKAKEVTSSESAAVIILPDKPWARRVSGVYGNALASQSPDRAHAIITCKNDGSYLVSVRSPLNNKKGADEICRRFPTGGGRKSAAGINNLPESMFHNFVDCFSKYYSA